MYRHSSRNQQADPYYIQAVANGTITLRERDTTDQLIGKIDEVIAVVSQLVSGQIDWQEAATMLEKYSGVQEVAE
jgi:glycyl-tRNA synthetase